MITPIEPYGSLTSDDLLKLEGQISSSQWRFADAIAITQADHRTEFDQPQLVYNIEVAHAHTYFIGKWMWWVHNATVCAKAIVKHVIKKGRAVFKASNGVGLEVRAIRDLGHISESTLEVMAREGFAPKIKVNEQSESLVLHHHKQNPKGPIIEIPASKHKIGNKNQHPHGNQKGKDEERAKFDTCRKEYWRDRAKKELERRKGK